MSVLARKVDVNLVQWSWGIDQRLLSSCAEESCLVSSWDISMFSPSYSSSSGIYWSYSPEESAGSRFGLKTLKLSSAVVAIRQAYWGWNLSSLMLFWPWWRNIICGGIYIPSSSLIESAYSASSTSTEKSHKVILLSAEVTASTDSSRGSNYIEVIASPCQWI